MFGPCAGGGLDLRGFSGAATFVRGVFDKLGIEPQVQRIGKYKSFGDTFNRTMISEAQREVISSLICESSEFWADSIASFLNKSSDEIKTLWVDKGIKSAYDFKEMGYITDVKYLDEVEKLMQLRYRKPYKKNVFELTAHFFSSNTAKVRPEAFLANYTIKLDSIKNEIAEKEFDLLSNDHQKQSGINSSPPHKKAAQGVDIALIFPNTT